MSASVSSVALAFQRPKCRPEGLDDVDSFALRHACWCSDSEISRSSLVHCLAVSGFRRAEMNALVYCGCVSLLYVPSRICAAPVVSATFPTVRRSRPCMKGVAFVCLYFFLFSCMQHCTMSFSVS